VNSRLENVLIKLKRKNLDCLIVTEPANISYLTEFISRDAYLLISKKQNICFTDARYTAAAKSGLKNTGILLKKTSGPAFKIIAAACKNLKARRAGFEEDSLTFGQYKKISENLDNATTLVPTRGLIEDFRQIKDREELEKIRKATRITIKALEFIRGRIAPGKKEIEIAAELERFIRYNGANSSAFEIIVASGPNSSFPHHRTGQRKIKNNELVLVDIGSDYLGYKSDLTRVFFLGKISVLARRIFNIVSRAQESAVKVIRPGIWANKIDAAARQYIAKKGYGGFFSHSLGHGIGLEVHERPRISSRQNNPLKAGMVFTVEPAIYLPGKFGIRLEDMVLVTRKDCEVLSGALHKRC